MTSADGKACSINVRVSQKTFYTSNLKQVADCFRVPIEKLEEVFDDWRPADLKEHLTSYPAAVLDSLESQRRYAEHPTLGRFSKPAKPEG